MKRSSKRRLALSTLFVALGIFFLFVGGSLWLINQPQVVERVIGNAMKENPWQISFEELRLNPFTQRIGAGKVIFEHRADEKRVEAHDVSMRVGIFGLMSGKLTIDRLSVREMLLHFPQAEQKKEKQKPKSIPLRQILLLQNLTINEAQIQQFLITFGKEAQTLRGKEFRLSFDRSLFGKSRLSVRMDQFNFSKAQKRIAAVEQINLITETTIEKWTDTSPYINNLTGELSLQEGVIEGTKIDSIVAKLSLADQNLSLDPLTLTISQNTLRGTISANLVDESFQADIRIPEPLPLPHLIAHTSVIDTAGKLSGKITFSGIGFLPSSSTGSGRIELTHRLNATVERPYHLATDVALKKGQLFLSNAALTVHEKKIALEGNIDIPKKRMTAHWEGGGFPLEYAFEHFRDDELERIFGNADFKGNFEGWGRDFQVQIEGSVRDGGWRPINVELANVVFKATYDKLSVVGSIVQGGEETGKADFELRYGKKVPGEKRSKTIQVNASIANYDIGASLKEAAGFTGRGNGTLQLHGPHHDVQGSASIVAKNGTWHNIAYERLSSELRISKKQILFAKNQLKLEKLEEQRFVHPLVLDIEKSGFRIQGEPIAGLSFDLLHKDQAWSLQRVHYRDPVNKELSFTASGAISPENELNINITGRADLRWLQPFSSLVREAAGPVDLELSVRGTLKDPSFFGSIGLNRNLFFPRTTRLRFENLEGDLKLKGKTIEFQNVTSLVDDGIIDISGEIDHQMLTPSAARLVLSARSFPYRAFESSFRLQLDANLTVRGAFPSPLVSGDITIIDGRYTKDFLLIDPLTGEKKIVEVDGETSSTFNPSLDVKIRNAGDFSIRNNIGNISLRIDVAATGTQNQPKINGTVSTIEGEIFYLGIEFILTRGFIEFHGRYGTPYLEVTGEKEVGIYNIVLNLRGETDNLHLDLSATSPSGPLEKRDVISLLTFGVTESDLQQNPSLRQGQLTTQVIGSQVTSVIERPLSKFAHLDVFRLEAADPESQSISRVYIGKQLSDRLSVDFSTDINTEEAVQTITSEYLLTDNLLLKGLRSSEQHYGIRGVLRFRSR